MRRRALIVLVVLVLMAALLALPAMASAANGKGAAPPGLHKAPAAANAPVHTVCLRCHMDPGFSACTGADCHAVP
jgi:hypothetical protein